MKKEQAYLIQVSGKDLERENGPADTLGKIVPGLGYLFRYDHAVMDELTGEEMCSMLVRYTRPIDEWLLRRVERLINEHGTLRFDPDKDPTARKSLEWILGGMGSDIEGGRWFTTRNWIDSLLVSGMDSFTIPEPAENEDSVISIFADVSSTLVNAEEKEILFQVIAEEVRKAVRREFNPEHVSVWVIDNNGERSYSATYDRRNDQREDPMAPPVGIGIGTYLGMPEGETCHIQSSITYDGSEEDKVKEVLDNAHEMLKEYVRAELS
jgi:hypothetical protein